MPEFRRLALKRAAGAAAIIGVILALIFVSACRGAGSDSYQVIYRMDGPVASVSPTDLSDAGDRRYRIGFVPKVADIPYFNVAKQGAQEAAWDLGIDLIYEGPSDADPEDQIRIIRDLIEKRVDVIAVSANDPERLVPVLQEARSAGVRVITWDSDARPEAREFFVNMVDPETLGRHLLDTLALSMGERGQYAILTGSLAASNLNEWIKWIEAQNRDYYPELRLVKVVPNDDDPALAYEGAKQLINDYPDLQGIIGTSSVGPPAAAQAVKEAGRAGKIDVVGLSTPSLMENYLHDGSAQVATLWSPKKLGYLTVVLARNMLLDLMPYDDQEIAKVGNIRVDGDRVIMGEPLDFTKDNVDQYDF